MTVLIRKEKSSFKKKTIRRRAREIIILQKDCLEIQNKIIVRSMSDFFKTENYIPTSKMIIRL